MFQPHADHFGHVLNIKDREYEDHHFEPVNVSRDIIQSKHRARKNKYRRRRHLSNLMKASSEITVSDFDQELVEEPREDETLEGLGEAGPPELHLLERSESSESQVLPSIETQV